MLAPRSLQEREGDSLSCNNLSWMYKSIIIPKSNPMGAKHTHMTHLFPKFGELAGFSVSNELTSGTSFALLLISYNFFGLIWLIILWVIMLLFYHCYLKFTYTYTRFTQHIHHNLLTMGHKLWSDGHLI